MFRKYSQQQKLAVLRQLEERSVPIAVMAAQMGVSRSTLHRWAREARTGSLDCDLFSDAELSQELQALRQENQRLKQELTLLKQLITCYLTDQNEV